MSAPKKLGIIAGGGELPRRLIEHCQAQNIKFCVAGISNLTHTKTSQPYPPMSCPRRRASRKFFTILDSRLRGSNNNSGIQNYIDKVTPDKIFRIGHASKIINFFHHENVSDVVFIGSVTVPSWLHLFPDGKTFQFFLTALIKGWGDDGLLKGARKILEGEGFCVRGIHEFLPELLMPKGVLGTIKLDEKYQVDIQLGIKESQKLGKKDMGQAVMVKDGKVIAREDKRGTNAMIYQYGVAGAILIKTCKPQQDRDLDLPTLGLNTVKACAEKKISGIVGQAGHTLIVDQEEMINEADQHGIFVMGVSLND